MEGLVSTSPGGQLPRDPQQPIKTPAAAVEGGGAHVVGTSAAWRASQEHAEEPYMLHPPHPCAPSSSSTQESSSSSSVASATFASSFSGGDLTTCSPVGVISTYPTFPCKREFVCNPKPAFPEVDLHEIDAKVLPPVKLIQGPNYQVHMAFGFFFSCSFI